MIFWCNGHNVEEMLSKFIEKKDSVPFANTVKGHGVSFMENNLLFEIQLQFRINKKRRFFTIVFQLFLL